MVGESRRTAAVIPASDGLVGRARERVLLLDAIRSAATGRGSVVVLQGEPGVGKTRLTAAAVAAAAPQLNVVVAECFEGEQAMPFRCWSEVFRTLGPAEDPLRAILANISTDAGTPDRLESDDDSDLGRLRLFDRILVLLQERTAEQPWLLVLEDLHWADGSSLGLLRHIARRVRRLGLVILATYRDSEVSAGHSLKAMEAEIRERRLGEVLRLTGLSPQETAELASAHGLPPADEAAARLLQVRTGGNPFFIEELVRHLRERAEDGGGSLKGGEAPAVPPAITDVLRSRLAKRSAECRAALAAAAILGHDFGTAAVDAIRGLVPGSSSAGLREASAARLLDGAGPDLYRFTHALVQETLLAELPAEEARTLHLGAAALLETRGAHPAAIARHYRLALSAGHVAPLIQHSKAAILSAADSLAPDESRELFWQTLDALDTIGVDRLARARFLGDILPPIFQRVGLNPEGLHALATGAAEELLAAEDGQAASMFVVAYWPLVIQDSLVDADPLKGLELMQKVRDLTGDPYAIACDAHAPFALFMTANDDEVPAIAARLRARSDFPGARVGATICDAAFAANRGRTAAALSSFRQAWEQTTVIPPSLAPAIVGQGGFAARWAAEVWMRFRAPALECELAERELPLKRQHATALRNLRLVREVARRERGQPSSTFADLARNDPFRPDWPHLRSLNLAFREGRWTEAFETASAVLPRIQPAAREPRSMLAEQLAEWRRHWDPAGAHGLLAPWQFEHGLPLIRVSAHALAGLIAAEAGDFESVRGHAASARSAMSPGDDWLGLGARVALLEAVCCTVDGDDAAATEQFASALREFRRVRHPWDEADALYVFGAVLCLLGRPHEAANHFRNAVEILNRIEAPEVFLQRVEQRAGWGRRQPVRTDPFARLTSRESEVLSLLIDGRSNREIAAALVVSEATVATHVRHLLEKSGTSNRTEAAALALRSGFRHH